ncbi:aminodeoxychorismate synthase [Cyanobacterium aponinum UTEX 3221]|uniref:aminodeoxychorismate synthase n=1 Tax=Cyanobacterium aponinum TaxID=379064 RepID=UPI002B4BAD88|nr:aminodeoxychorismate synthase [Cyanobacterium aponinum]WRL37776.1 aminodeoxychorismate synthase [Cyanobacterium aponinum UTEX 3221]
MRTLIIDNYDSFTYNIYQLVAEINQEKPIIITNNQLSWQEIEDNNFDNIIISPGPGNPKNRKDFGVCQDVLLNSNIPILGICLGHQGLGYYYDAQITKAPEPYHGRISKVYHNSNSIFDGIPSPFSVVRYHSLLIANNPANFPSNLEIIAHTEDNLIMGIKHKLKPFWGVQFHPESICSEYGEQILTNFNILSEKYYLSHNKDVKNIKLNSFQNVADKIILNKSIDNKKQDKFKLFSQKLDFYVDSEIVFEHLYRDANPSFWLDSSMIAEGLSRFSYMGDCEGENSFFISYDVNTNTIIQFKKEEKKIIKNNIFDFLQQYLDQYNNNYNLDLPFNFNGGFVGYFGYELKALCGYKNKHISSYPDAQFIFADRMIVFDHLDKCIYLVYLGKENSEQKANNWFKNLAEKLFLLHQYDDNQSWEKSSNLQLKNSPKKADILWDVNSKVSSIKDNSNTSKYSKQEHLNNIFKANNDNFYNDKFSGLSIYLSRNKKEYLDNIESSLQKIRLGESYEICLTNHLYLPNINNSLDFYSYLRTQNSAPYSCFFRFNDLSIVSCSPERFLHLDKQGNLESKPIKGTVKRGKTKDEDEQLKNQLKCSEKEQAENLMIVDLLRNDLGKVCQVGSVTVPKLMAIESYSTVHQMVSTVKGKIKEGIKTTDCIKACFPGGSMTGAPKKRTLEIIDDLETEARGIYSGCIGFLALNGTMDLNIVIRTAIITPEKTAIGVGGAITYLSSPELEFAETMLKAQALLNAALFLKVNSE